MSSHLAIELLSSYLDEEVTTRQLRLVEDHLDDCAECRSTLEGLRSVAQSVRRLESVAPPSTLGVATERRLRIAALEEARGLDIERSLGRWLKQPVLAPVFAIVLALAAILYLFAYGVARRGESPRSVPSDWTYGSFDQVAFESMNAWSAGSSSASGAPSLRVRNSSNSAAV